MARFSKNHDEMRHVVKIERETPFSGIVEFKLKDGTTIEGVITGTNSGNNFSKPGQPPTAYRAEFTIKCLDESMHIIDALDVESTKNLWEQRKEIYEKAGLIRIFNPPE